jgi:very-short-patch-repair endonuclease
MTSRYRKPRVRVGAGASGAVVGVAGEGGVSGASTYRGPRPVQRKAKRRRKTYTPAERQLEQVLNSVGSGVLRGKFHREWAFGPWIVDYFLWEIRLAIEVDGPSHRSARQRQRDRLKTQDLEKADITVIRISNEEALGDQDALVSILRDGYRAALSRRNRVVRPSARRAGWDGFPADSSQASQPLKAEKCASLSAQPMIVRRRPA